RLAAPPCPPRRLSRGRRSRCGIRLTEAHTRRRSGPSCTERCAYTLRAARHSPNRRSALVACRRLADATGGWQRPWLPIAPGCTGKAAGDPGGRAHGRRVCEQDATDLLDREWIALYRVSGERDHELGFDTVDARALVRDDAVGRVRSGAGS